MAITGGSQCLQSPAGGFTRAYCTICSWWGLQVSPDSAQNATLLKPFIASVCTFIASADTVYFSVGRFQCRQINPQTWGRRCAPDSEDTRKEALSNLTQDPTSPWGNMWLHKVRVDRGSQGRSFFKIKKYVNWNVQGLSETSDGCQEPFALPQ